MAGVLESAGIAALLAATLLPATVLAGGAAFVPWRRELWSVAHLRAVLDRHGRVLGALLAMLPVYIAQSQLDPWTTALVGRDFTPFFAGFDGGLHAAVQAALPAAVEWAFAVVYLLGFPVLLYLTPILAAWLGDGRTAARAFAVYAGLYLAALPFYFFFPVLEVWTTGQAENLAVLTPETPAVLYAFNDVNNAFPSMHTAMALAVGWVAWRGPSRRWAWTAAAIAGLIPLSTIVLGIHWSLDVAAGSVLAIAACVAVDRALPPPA